MPINGSPGAGDADALSEDDFVRLSTAFLTQVEKAYG
jgi:hypothetical protein